MSEDVGGQVIVKVAEKILDPITEIIRAVALPAAVVIGRSFAESVDNWRMRRNYETFEKMQEFWAQKGIYPKSIPLKLLLPALDYASVEEDEYLHTTWAALLANAADPDVDFVPACFIEILRQLSVSDAKFIFALWQRPLARSLMSESEMHRPFIIQDYEFDNFLLSEIWCGMGFS